MTGKNASLVEQDAAAAQVLLARANELSTAMEKYRVSESAEPVRSDAPTRRQRRGTLIESPEAKALRGTPFWKLICPREAV